MEQKYDKCIHLDVSSDSDIMYVDVKKEHIHEDNGRLTQVSYALKSLMKHLYNYEINGICLPIYLHLMFL